MNFERFQQSTDDANPPAELPLVLAALWWDAKGNWTMAHECAQQRETPAHAWVHAYLHRKEGDLTNARYWYRRAGRNEFTGSLQDEWRSITQALIEQNAAE